MNTENFSTAAAAFYDSLAAGYDAMTGFAARLRGARRFAAALRAKYPPGAVAVDLATGTGLYAIALAEQGAAVTGVDISEEMLAVARTNAAAAGARADWCCASMESFAAQLAPGAMADLILCLGNSLPHLLTAESLTATLAQARQVLGPGGVLGIQLLNYARILERQERIVSIDRAGATEYLRFYDFPEDRRFVRFNILTVTWPPEAATADPGHVLSGVPLRAFTAAELRDELERAGFGGIEFYGGLDFRPFEPATSETVLLMARRQ